MLFHRPLALVVASLALAACGPKSDAPVAANPAPGAAAPAPAGGAVDVAAEQPAAAREKPTAAPGKAAGAPVADKPAPVKAATPAPAASAWAYACSDAVYGHVYLSSLQQVLDRSQKLVKAVEPETPDGMLTDQLAGLFEGNRAVLDAFDRTRPAAIVLLDPKDKTLGEFPAVAVIPVKDAAALRAALVQRRAPPPGLPEGVNPDDFVPPALVEKAGAEGVFEYSREVESMDFEAWQAAQAKAVAAEEDPPSFEKFKKKETKVVFALRDVPGHVLLGSASAAVLALARAPLPPTCPPAPTDDLVVTAHARRLADHFKEEVDKGMGEMKDGMAREMDGQPGMPADLTGWMDRFVEIARTVVGEVREVRLAVGLAEPAARLRIAATFPADGKVGKFLAGQVLATSDLVACLPADCQGVFSGRMAYTAEMREMFEKLTNDTMRGMGEPMADAAKRWQGLMQRSFDSNTGEVAMGGAYTRAGGLWFVQVARVTDAAKARAVLHESADAIREVFGAFGAQLPEEVKLEVTSTADAATHGDIPLDRMHVRFSLEGDRPEAQMVNGIVRDVLGADGLELFVGGTGDVLVAAGGRDAQARCGATLDVARRGGGAGPKGDFPSVASALPPKPAFLVYLAPLEIAGEALEMAVKVQGQACLAHQAEVGKAAQAFRTLNGAWPEDVHVLYTQGLLGAGGSPCTNQTRIDVNSGGVRCTRHGTVDAPKTGGDPGEMLGFGWKRREGSGGGAFAYYGRVFVEGGEAGAEVGIVVPHRTVGDMAVAIREGMSGAKGSAQEASAIGTLRSLTTAQEQFKQQCVVDQDGDGMGEYGTLGELSGLDACRVGGQKMDTSPFIPAVLGVKDAEGRSQKAGYYFRLFLPTGTDAARGEGSGPAEAAQADADVQEVRWTCYAWPVNPGGGRTFIANHSGEVYATDADVRAYGGDVAPDADAAYDRTMPSGKNLDAGIGLAAAGLKSVDGNVWVPAGN